VSEAPCEQLDFSVNATYWRPSGAIATDGSPQAHLSGSSAGPALDHHVRPPSLDEKTRIRGSSDSFAAPKRTRPFEGSAATATSVCMPSEREMSWTFAPATRH
jgi:hypothetical protein